MNRVDRRDPLRRSPVTRTAREPRRRPLRPRHAREIHLVARRRRHTGGVHPTNLRRARVGDHAPALQQQRARAQRRHRGEVVADEQHGAPLALPHLAHLPQALVLERLIADGQHFVHQQDVGVEMRRDGEGEPHRHPARVALDRHVEERLDAGELDDLVEPLPDLGAAHSDERAVEEDVLAAGELRMESGPHLEQRADAPVDVDVAGGRRGHAGDHLEQRALARAVATDEPDDLPLADLARHVAQRPEAVRLARRPRAAHPVGHLLGERRATACRRRCSSCRRRAARARARAAPRPRAARHASRARRSAREPELWTSLPTSHSPPRPAQMTSAY